jgi:hypothetical protein
MPNTKPSKERVGTRSDICFAVSGIILVLGCIGAIFVHPMVAIPAVIVALIVAGLGYYFMLNDAKK